ncbi:MAG: helicase-exonuclease AddAB subunit AddA [Lachnospiraceae bacterium]
MAIQWSKEQRQVIETRRKNILVSAAAGSGKTAVLVERIIQKITDPNAPVDIDSLLVVTFTHAAASEMRERIADAIEKKTMEDPENLNLQRQLTLVHNAQITTIDSFCLYVIRNYFHKIDLEPGFRVADEGEMALMKSDVLDALMIRQYEEADPEFLAFSDLYSAAKSDNAIRDMVMKLYQYSMSYPWPDEWLLQVEKSYDIPDADALPKADWMQHLLQYLRDMAKGFSQEMQRCLTLCQDADGPDMYEAAVQSDVDQLLVLSSATDWCSYRSALQSLNFAKLGVSRKFAGSTQKKDEVKNTRDAVKKEITKIKEQFFFASDEEIVETIKKTAPYLKVLVRLTREFSEAFAAKKREKNVIDFSDMEHLALQILVDEETKEPTDTAKEFSKRFEEIMIDEYQDSNYVQETILTAISRERMGQNNLFMVGDVKQSIYRFRLARPELFMEKYETYETDGEKKQRIDLHKNFRSRKEIVETVNDVFFDIMQKDLGNVEYNEAAQLNCGATFPEREDPNQFQTELLVCDPKEREETGGSGFEMEAAMTAKRIQELMQTQKVTDKETGELRPLRYSDIVILFRSFTGTADIYVEVLEAAGIPAHTESRTGYFSTIEIQTVLNLLRVLDNPKQDIPLTAVLTSPLVGISEEELAKIKAAFLKLPFCEAVKRYALYGTDAYETLTETEVHTEMIEVPLQEKLRAFWRMQKRYRQKAVYLPIHQLIEEVLAETGYADYVAALPGGARKRANIQMLVEKAIAYEATSYRGLFHFVRYIEKLQKYQVDFGEAELNGEADNTVRIMTIHKSKGLEFPVVFVGATAKQFNKQDSRARLILHPELGAGLDYVDGERRTKKPTLLKKVLVKETELENLGEELRVLYVALTRAKERLIMTASVKDAAEKLQSLCEEREELELQKKSSFFARVKAASYFDWLVPVLAANQVRYKIRQVTMEELKQQETAQAVRRVLKREEFEQQVKQVDASVYASLEKKLSYVYPFEKEANVKTKVSVSELKHKAMEEQEEIVTEQWFSYEEEKEPIPRFMQETVEENQGALRGSAFHRAMECLDFVDVYQALSDERRNAVLTAAPTEKPELTKEERRHLYGRVMRQLEERQADGRIPQEMFELIRAGQITDFFATPLAMRMAAAEKQKTLMREKPFVMGIAAKEVQPESDSEELVLIQGIIDGFFEENGQIIVMDYKTDSVDDGQELVRRYREQLALYARALERITGKPVTERIIYSAKLKQEIVL